nr:alpha/beta fold hydrolase [uncultured Azospirillum sp.]
MKRSYLSMLLALAAPVVGQVSAHAEQPSIGFQKLSLPATDKHRALEVALWYPAAAAGDSTLVGDNPAFVGTAVRVGAPPQPGRHGLVVLSHGYGGNWTNQQWLAADLAAHGYLVAAANHPGSTSRDMAPPGAAMLWKRPGDVSRVIDWLNDEPRWSGLLIPGHAAVVGHSLGGWTAVALAGGRFEPWRLKAACDAHPLMAACGPEIGGLGSDGRSSQAWATQPLADERIKAVVTLDLGLSQGFDPESLSRSNAAFLVVGAAPGNPLMPVELESRHLAGSLPSGRTRYVEIGDAGHFSFLSVCKADAIPVLEAERPGDGVICRDHGGRTREAIHRQVSDLVVSFLDSSFLESAMPPQ